MLMAASEAIMRVCDGLVPLLFSSGPYFSKSLSESRTSEKYRKRASHSKVLNCSISISPQFSHVSSGNVATTQKRYAKCKCQRPQSANGISSEGGNGAWFVDNAKEFYTVNVNTPNVLEFKEFSSKKEVTSNSNLPDNGSVRDTLQTVIADSVEDEAWELLRESIVYYCGNPIGTIAAKDPSSSNVLNYDQVFIRDFIPSGIAFLLKGEYDLVRNFILHTLQLQVGMIVLIY